MQKPWCPCPTINLEPVDAGSQSTELRGHLDRCAVDFALLGFEFRGDYELHRDEDVEVVRFLQSTDGAVLGRINQLGTKPAYEFGSVLEDGTYVRSIPSAQIAPWNCCRFPVHVIFGPGCSVEDLLVRHLNGLAELERGCGVTNRYAPHRLEEVVTYQHELVHETVYAQGAPHELLAVPEPASGKPLMGV